MIREKVRSGLVAKDSTREKILPPCREVIRYSGLLIWAVHRQKFDLTLTIRQKEFEEKLEKLQDNNDQAAKMVRVERSTGVWIQY